MTQPHGWQRKDWLLLILLIGLGVAVRALATTLPRVAWGDEPYYLWIGRSFWAGTGFNAMGYSAANFPPLFPLLAGAVDRLTGNLIWASNLVYIVTGALLVWPLTALARAIYSPLAGWLVGLVTALYPALVTGVLTWGTMTEPLYLLLIGLAIYALFRALDDQPMRWRHFIALGTALSLAYLTRTEALVFLAAALLLLLAGLMLRREHWSRVLARLASVIIVFLLVAAPYLVYIQRSTGHWSLTGAAGMAFTSMSGLVTNDPATFDRATWELDPLDNEVFLFSRSSGGESVVTTVLADPLAMLRRFRQGASTASALLWSLKLAPWIFAALAALGLFARSWPARRLRGEAAMLASLAAPLAYLPFFVQERYLAGLLLPIMVWLGAGVEVLGEWLRGSVENLRTRPLSTGQARALTLVPVLVLAVVMLLLSPLVWRTMQRTHSFQPGHLAAATALRAAGATSDDVLLSRYPAIALHANMRWAATPAEDWPTVLAYARQHQATYLAMDSWEASLRPQLDFLLIPTLAPPELRYLTTLETGETPVVLYKFVP
ncbi:MAG: glycosyltransferase family 39 protein [Anaerolineae bacterium]